MEIGLLFKMILLVTILFSFAGYITATRHITAYEFGLSEAYTKNSKLIGLGIATTVHELDYLENKKELFEIIQTQMWNNPEILFISFSKQKNDSLFVFSSSKKNNEEKISSKENIDVFESGIQIIFDSSHEKKEEVFVVITPIKISGKVYGTVEIHLSKIVLKNNIKNQIYSERILVSAVWFIIFIIFYLFLKKVVITPIYKIKKGLEQVSKNDLNYKIKKLSNDEFGELAKSFDFMRLEIQKNRKELDEYNKDLEGEVNKRTKDLEKKIKELEKFSKIVIGRELKMMELKKQLRRYEEEYK